MTKPGPSVTSGADTQPGSDSLFPSGFGGGGASVRAGGVGTTEIADGSVAAADLNLASVAAAIAARSELTGTYATKVGPNTLTGTWDFTGATVSGVSGGGSSLTTLGSSNGTGDAATINAAIAGGGSFRGKPGTTYILETALVVPSNTAIDFTGCTLQLKAALANGNMVQNYAATNPAATGLGSMTSGSAVVTSSLTVSVGQTVTVNNAAGDGVTSLHLCGKVVSTGSGTFTLDTAATTSVSSVTVKAYTRDRNIAIKGGAWARGSVGGAASLSGHSFFFRHVDQITVDIDSFTSSAGMYAMSFASVTDYTAGIGYCNSALDGIHVMGPAYGGRVTRIGGYTTDDSISLTANDYAGALSDVCGDIRDFRWDICNTRAGQSNVKIMTGMGRVIDGVVGGLTSGSFINGHGVYIGEDTPQPGTMGGTYGKIDAGTITSRPEATGHYPLWLESPAADSIRAAVRYTSANDYAAVIGGTSTATLGHLALDVDVTGPAGVLRVNNSTQTVTSVMVDGYYQQVSGGGAAITVTAGTVESIETRLTANLTGYLVQQSSSAGVLKKLRHHGRTIGGFGVFNGVAGVNGPLVTLGGHVKGSTRVVNAAAPTKVLLAGAVLEGITSQPFQATVGPLRVRGDASIISPGTVGLTNSVSSAPVSASVHSAGAWAPSDHGYLTWAFDPCSCGSATPLGTNGTAYCVRLRVDEGVLITNIVMLVGTAGSGLTSGQCFASLFVPSNSNTTGALVATTADQSTAWASTGPKTMALASPYTTTVAGDIIVVVWANGTTRPAFARGSNVTGSINPGLGATSYRNFTADTGLTTTPPSTLAAATGLDIAYWAALS